MRVTALSRRGLEAFRTQKSSREDTSLMSLSFSPVEKSLKLAVIVSKQVSPRAVVRNRLKRQAKGAFISEMRTRALFGMYVVRLKPQAREATYQDFCESFSLLFGRLNKRYNTSR